MNKGKIVTGTIVALSSPKTVSVAVESVHRHPLYRKAVRRTKKFLAQNDGIELTIGNTVEMQEVSPISKLKHYRITKKLT